MPRGITQDQVNDAADAILSTGENPTVEKVRGKLGTGSPNTITRMLDAWRRGLGERLQQLTALPDLPAAAGQAMFEVWRLACEHAEEEISARFVSERESIEAARAELTREREDWQARLEEADSAVSQAQTAQELAESACATIDGQLQDSHALRADLVQQRDRIQKACDRQAEEIEDLRTQLNQSTAALEETRSRQETYLRSVEERSHQEIDRARQDAKQWQKRHEAAERAHQANVASLQKQNESLRDQLRKTDTEVARYAGLVAGLEKALGKARSTATSSRRTKNRNSKDKSPVKAAKRQRATSRKKKAGGVD